MDTFVFCIAGFLGLTFFIVATVYERQFYHYLKAEHPIKAEEFVLDSFMGI
jgi:hypothetical protein